MHAKRIFRHKPFVVDGQRYLASLTANYEEFVRLRVTVRADFGTRSFCTFNGLHNFDYYFNYGHWNETDTITVTPRLIAVLIRYGRHNGWNPEASKSNCQIDITNTNAKAILNEYDGVNDFAGQELPHLNVASSENGTNNPMNPAGRSGVS